jgi:hypothetical protein
LRTAPPIPPPAALAGEAEVLASLNLRTSRQSTGWRKVRLPSTKLRGEAGHHVRALVMELVGGDGLSQKIEA